MVVKGGQGHWRLSSWPSYKSKKKGSEGVKIHPTEDSQAQPSRERNRNKKSTFKGP